MVVAMVADIGKNMVTAMIVAMNKDKCYHCICNGENMVIAMEL